MATIYTVVPESYEMGDDLLPLLDQVRKGWMTYDEAELMVADKWPDWDPATYMASHAAYVHFYPTAQDAMDHVGEFGGIALAVDADELKVQIDKIELGDPHPVVMGPVPGRCVRPLGSMIIGS